MLPTYVHLMYYKHTFRSLPLFYTLALCILFTRLRDRCDFRRCHDGRLWWRVVELSSLECNSKWTLTTLRSGHIAMSSMVEVL